MMQQLATQRSNIAVLPVETDEKAKAPDTQGDSGFASTFDSVTEAHERERQQSLQQKNAEIQTTKRHATEDLHQGANDDQEANGQLESRSTIEGDDLNHLDDNVVIEKAEEHTASDEGVLEQQNDVALSPDNPLVTEGQAQRRETQEENTDYLTFVDAIRQLHGGEQYASEGDVTADLSDDSHVFVDGDIPTIDENGNVIQEGYHEDFAALIDVLKTVGESTDAQSASTDGELPGDLTALAESLNDAIAQWLDNEQADGENLDAKVENEQDIQVLAAALMAALHKASNEDKRKVEEKDGQGDDALLALNDDGGLLVELLKAELGGDSAHQGKGDEQQSASQQAPESSPDAVPGESGAIMQLFGQAETTTRDTLTDALSENIIGALPAGLSEKQSTAFKQNVADIVADYQKQLAAGDIPAQTLEAQITDALGQIAADENNDISALVANEVRQLNLVASAALQTIQSSSSGAAFVHAATSHDTATVDLQQVKAERVQHQDTGANDKGVNIQQPEGQQQLAEKVRWMVNARNSMAEIRLDPPELGSMQVRVNVSGDSAAVSFIVQSSQAKDVLMNAEPRLRDMLAEQGIALGESSVSQQQDQGNFSEGDDSEGGSGSSHLAGEGTENSTVIEQPLTRQAQGGIDDYA
ncbi:flagellar hook-length control protein FliK [Alteromonas sp. C1M14]|uniref:flagellar hook-length control protein FliK n=1 Tax=Alteromonas sp. C1M14 TaxID=2841567 RepID=UPI002091372F|nr:flagellar hook-length control protein FliK [Alteromonas sp. C1M14]